MTREFFLKEWLEERHIPFEQVRHYDVTLGRHEFGKGYFANKVKHVDIPGLTFTVDLAEGGGVLRFVATADKRAGGSVTTRALRDANLGNMAIAVRAAWALETERTGMASPGMVDRYRGEIRKQETTATPGLTDVDLAQAMLHYIDACDDGGSSREAAATFGCTKDQMDYYRKLAIRRGLFKSFGRQGRRGGFLLPKGIAALEEASR